jgi:hypothetical protein
MGKAREECYDLMYNIRCNLEIELKEKFYESDDRNDSPIPRITKSRGFEAWESFNIATFNINCFGFGNWESLLLSAEEHIEKYYQSYIKK